ncbi:MULTISPECIES: hypothetical protein [unclassified Ensifer]|uniref:hypothetical protein n=1 Tax=unclassified Ensifer TaxID=2633371 RepID=UPI0008136A6A|nr:MULTISPECIES: hypothetical protein [unclassified Ensifer]OCP18357.1 hypothetical protein BC361_06780 [Ensifer sp. LC54]OCP27470.1 hypothetical protein BC363_13250 [Ensifer sp. LC384]
MRFQTKTTGSGFFFTDPGFFMIIFVQLNSGRMSRPDGTGPDRARGAAEARSDNAFGRALVKG